MRSPFTCSFGMAALLCLWFTPPGQARPTGDIQRLYVFGDSYSDTGAGYVDCDGPTAVAYLAKSLGFTLIPSTDRKHRGQSLNFAVSGAGTGSSPGSHIGTALLGLGMQNQVQDFAERVRSGSIRFQPKHTLFFLAGGLNDKSLPSDATVANIKGEIETLYRSGARRFRVALLPTAIPAFAEVGKRLNPRLERIPAEITAEFPDARIALSHWGEFFDEVMRNPASYGIENTESACAGRALFHENATPCANPATYYYYHAGHPSTAVHKAVGAKLYGEFTAAAAPPLTQSASRGIPTRDPSSIVKCNDEYWMFYSGRGVPSYHSHDLETWQPGPAVFSAAPEWIAAAVPENRGMDYWAPDVKRVGDRYLLYYAVSSMGKITSAIGLATNPTLDPRDPAFHWTDQGLVVQSRAEGDFNAIDPAVFQDGDGSLWMVFGSQWSGIKLVQLDPKTGKRLSLHSPRFGLANHAPIEASFLYKKEDYYYLFANWGSCCRGVRSTYNIRMGRSKKITGPYLSEDGTDMLKEGGSLFLESTGPLKGPGHAGILEDDGKDWFTCDFEGDVRLGGKPTLAILPFHWNPDGWPRADLQEGRL